MAESVIGYKALRKGRVSEAGRLYFVTKIARRRVHRDWRGEKQLAEGSLLRTGVPEIILGSLRWFEARELIKLVAYCLMPDHLHLLIQLGEAADLSNVIQRFSSYTGLQVHRQTGLGGLWFVGFHDHALRSETPVLDIVNYIEFNPVRAGLILEAADWQWSSASWDTRPEVS